MFGIILAFVPGASAIDVEFCVEFETDFEDVGGGEDYWTTNANQPARGIWLSVVDNSTGEEKFPTHFTNSTGCATVNLQGQFLRSYRVKTLSTAKVNGIEIDAFDDAVSPQFDEVLHYSNFWVGATSVTLSIDYADTREVMLSVATWAMYRAPSALGAGTVIEMYHDASDTSSGLADINEVHWVNGWRSKYGIAHELGHVVGSLRDESSNPLFSYSSAGDGCPTSDLGEPGHTFNSKEYQSAAAVEGWADFYAAVLWNDTAESDCSWEWGIFDWDLDFTSDGFLPTFSCEGIPVSGLASYVTARGWLKDVVDAADPMGCGGTLVNRGNELDWMRFWWDMRTDEAVSYNTLMNMYDDMNPRTFDPNGSTSTAVDDPTSRLDAAATLNLVHTAYEDQKNNGVDH